MQISIQKLRNQIYSVSSLKKKKKKNDKSSSGGGGASMTKSKYSVYFIIAGKQLQISGGLLCHNSWLNDHHFSQEFVW